MSGKVQMRLAVLAALAALVAVLVPSGLAFGDHPENPIPAGNESVVLLTLGSQDKITWAELTENIQTKNNDCLFVQFSGDDLIEIQPLYGDLLGHVKDGFGAESLGGSGGTPCGQVEASQGEALSITLGADLDSYLMSAVDLDLELKFGADVDISYRLNGTEVASDNFNPMESSDDGPDSKDGDNYRYYFDPEDPDNNQVYFDEVWLTAASGAFSLEGGADLFNNNDPEAFGKLDPDSKSSQIAVVKTFNTKLSCGDTVSHTDGDITAEFTLVDVVDSDGDSVADGLCEKLVNFDVDGENRQATLEPEEGDGTLTAIFTGVLTAENELLDKTPGTFGLDSVGLTIDPDAPFTFTNSSTMEPCVLDADGNYVPTSGNGWGYTRSEGVPKYTENVGEGVVHVYGNETHEVCGTETDPSLRF